jgi:hypothetical protein
VAAAATRSSGSAPACLVVRCHDDNRCIPLLNVSAAQHPGSRAGAWRPSWYASGMLRKREISGATQSQAACTCMPHSGCRKQTPFYTQSDACCSHFKISSQTRASLQSVRSAYRCSW